MVVKLITCMVVRVFPVRYGMVRISGKAFCHGQGIGFAVVSLCISDAVTLRVGSAALPELGDAVQQIRMGLDVGAVDEPVIMPLRR